MQDPSDAYLAEILERRRTEYSFLFESDDICHNPSVNTNDAHAITLKSGVQYKNPYDDWESWPKSKQYEMFHDGPLVSFDHVLMSNFLTCPPTPLRPDKLSDHAVAAADPY